MRLLPFLLALGLAQEVPEPATKGHTDPALVQIAAFPNDPDGGDPPVLYDAQIEDPDARSLFRRVFLAKETPTLAERKKMSLSSGMTVQLGYKEAQIPLTNPPAIDLFMELGYCQIASCIRFNAGIDTILIYKERLPTFEAVAQSYRDGIAERLRCGVHARQPDPGCGDATHWYDWIHGHSIALPQTYWVDAADGAAIDWEPVNLHERGGRATNQDWANIEMISKMISRDRPHVCENKDTKTDITIASACGIFKDVEIDGTYYQIYCLSQGFPDFDPIYTNCVPLYKHTKDGWFVALLAGQIIDEGWAGSVDDAGCYFESDRPISEQAEILSRSFTELIGKNAAVNKSGNDQVRIGATRINVNLSHLSPRRPWGYVKLGISLNRNSTNNYSLYAVLGYTVSSRIMSSRLEGREASDEEAENIGSRFKEILTSTLTKISEQKVYCSPIS